MSKYLSILNEQKLQNPLSTGVVKKRSSMVAEYLSSAGDEDISAIYANNKAILGGQDEVIIVQTPTKLHIFYGKDKYTYNLESISITKGLIGQTNVRAIVGKKEKELLVYKAFDLDERFDKNVGNIVKDKFPKLEHPYEELGFRVRNHLNYLLTMLDENEDVLYLFVGQAANWAFNTTACAVTTNNNFVFASKGMIGDDNLKRFKISDVKEISVNSTLIVSNVVIETLTEKFTVNLSDKTKALTVHKTLRGYISRFESQVEDSKSRSTTSVSPAEEIKKFKTLLDEGIITEKEFEDKKKQLLGLWITSIFEWLTVLD